MFYCNKTYLNISADNNKEPRNKVELNTQPPGYNIHSSLQINCVVLMTEMLNN